MQIARFHSTRRTVCAVLALTTVITGTIGVTRSASATAGSDVLNPGDTLANEQEIRSSNGYQFVMQRDGNAVIYKPGANGRTAIWATNTSGRPNSYLAMQTDGNLVLYSNGAPYWASGVKGSGSYLVMQTDGNLVMYKPVSGGRTAVWASNTAQATPPSTGGTGCGTSMSMELIRSSSTAVSTNDMRLRVRTVTPNCLARTRVYRAGSGNGGRDSCASNNWLPEGVWDIGNLRAGDDRGFYRDGVGTLAGRSHFDLTLVSTPLACARPRQAAGTFAIHSEAGVKVPSSGSTITSSAGCVKLGATDLTDLYNTWAALGRAEHSVKLTVTTTSGSIPAVSGWTSAVIPFN